MLVQSTNELTTSNWILSQKSYRHQWKAMEFSDFKNMRDFAVALTVQKL